MTTVRAAIGLAALALSQPVAARELLVVNQPLRTLHLVDGDRGEARLVAKLGERPHEVEVSPDRRFAFLPIYGSGAVGRPGSDGDTVEMVDLSTGTVIAIPLGRGVRPHDAKFGPDGLLYVTAEVDEAVLVVDPAARRVVGRIPTGRPESHGRAISPDGRRAYTANIASGSVSVLDLRRRRLVAVIAVAEMVQRVTVSPDGARVFTHDQRTPHVVAIDARRLRVARRYVLPGLPYASAITADGRTMLVAGRPALPGAPEVRPALYRLGLATGQVETVDLPGWPRVIAIDDAARRAWMDLGSGEIASFDLATGAVRIVTRLERGLDGMTLLPRSGSSDQRRQKLSTRRR